MIVYDIYSQLNWNFTNLGFSNQRNASNITSPRSSPSSRRSAFLCLSSVNDWHRFTILLFFNFLMDVWCVDSEAESVHSDGAVAASVSTVASQPYPLRSSASAHLYSPASFLLLSIFPILIFHYFRFDICLFGDFYLCPFLLFLISISLAFQYCCWHGKSDALPHLKRTRRRLFRSYR